MARTTTIPIAGTRQYVLAFKAYAMSRGKNMSDLVRDALDAQYGKDIESAASSFFGKSGQDVIQQDNELVITQGPGAA